MTAVVETARAKVNLFLHVLGRRTDGYHDLESLAAFADIGDRLEAEVRASEPDDRLHIEGPEAGALTSGDNLVLRAARGFRAVVPEAPRVQFRLVKRLPVASGIGGGSADAAAALRALARLNGLSPEDGRLFDVAAELGADVPVCLADHAAWMRGVGERLEPVRLPELPAVLVNPRVPVETRRIFETLGLARGAAGPSRPLARRSDLTDDLLDFLAGQRNDLQPTAQAAAPVIGVVLARLGGAAGCRLARMSGSGATCFGLFGSAQETGDAAQRLAAAEPHWWVAATRLS